MTHVRRAPCPLLVLPLPAAGPRAGKPEAIRAVVGTAAAHRAHDRPAHRVRAAGRCGDHRRAARKVAYHAAQGVADRDRSGR